MALNKPAVAFRATTAENIEEAHKPSNYEKQSQPEAGMKMSRQSNSHGGKRGK
jgi:hypothetical protein